MRCRRCEIGSARGLFAGRGAAADQCGVEFATGEPKVSLRFDRSHFVWHQVPPILHGIVGRRDLFDDHVSQRQQASKRSLEWQGGPFSQDDAERFILQYFAADAVRLRQWDDAAKDPEASTPTLEYFIPIMKSLALPAAQADAAAA